MVAMARRSMHSVHAFFQHEVLDDLGRVRNSYHCTEYILRTPYVCM